MADRIRQMNTETLAYMGDAVYEQFIRERLVRTGLVRVNSLHKAATGYVKASAQAKAIRAMMGDGIRKENDRTGEGSELSKEEQALVKRARNHGFSSKAKNADPVTYKWATGFEALVGYLYLTGNNERMIHVMNRAVEITDGE